MDGDLNLSQALGGLRIANNPDTPPQSPRHTPESSSANSVKEGEGGSGVPGRPSGLRQEVYDEEENGRRDGGAGRWEGQRAGYDFPDERMDRDAPPRRYDLQDGGPSQLPPTQQHRQDYHPSSSARNSYVPMPQRHSQQYPPYNNYPNAYPDYNRITREPSRSSVNSRGPRDQRPIPDRTYRQSAPIGHFAPPRASSRNMGNGGYVENGPLASSEEWKEKGAAVSYRKEVDKEGKQITTVVKKGVKDFTFGRTLGEGSYSTVLAATDRTSLREFAVKVLDKRHIIKENKVKYVTIEKDTLNRLGDHPGIVKLYYTFQDERNLYFVLDLAAGGELLGFLKKIGSFDEECTRYYGAQILDAIEYMHSRGVIHRDLKPENVLLDEQMHVKITDFGTAKILNQPSKKSPTSPQDNQPSFDAPPQSDADRANSFVGTAEYVSPELLTEKSACKASDLWAFGCIIYQLLSGRPPFKAANEYLTFQKIVSLEYEFPRGFPPLARDLVERLLVLDPTKRLMIEHIKSHAFFRGIEWGRRLWKVKAPRLKAYIPPPPEEKIIKLNEFAGPPPNISLGGYQRNGANNGSNNSLARPPPPLRVITELPPPSQLDIEWSPVLTRPNERILKLGNCMVQSSHSHSSSSSQSNGSSLSEQPQKEGGNKLARFFSAVGSNTRRRQRLVMITSSARILIAQAGGEEKRVKTEIGLLGGSVSVRQVGGSPEGRIWAVETKDKRYTFEDAKASSTEWLDAIERAKQYAAAFPEQAGGGSEMSSPTGTLDGERRKEEERERKNAKRFSRRASKHGLAAVF